MGDLQIPHLNDPGDHNKRKQYDSLDFKVRVGTSLVRSGTESQAILIQKEFQEEEKINDLIFQITSRSISRRTTPSSSRRSSIDISNGYGIQGVVDGKRAARFLRRRKDHSALLRQWNSKPEVVYEGHRNPAEALQKFRKVARTIKLLCGILITLKSYVKKPDTSNWSFMEMYLHVQDTFNHLLTFNKNSYGKVEPLKEKLKTLLSVSKQHRTRQDVQTIMGLMRDNLSFQDYPVHIQIKLARCMQYQSYEARRVILKQGHPPLAFYIMLSGVAIVNARDVNPKTGHAFVKTVGQLVAGDTFGEIALIEGGPRTASVVCKTTCEFLVVQKHDFDDVIKAPLLREKENHIEFCKSLPFLKDFPCDIFRQSPKEFFFQYFKEDDIIIRNSVLSKYIVIVKSGKCKLVSDFTELPSDKRRVVFDPDLEEAFPLYTTMLRVKSRAPVPKSGSTESIAHIQIGLITGTVDNTVLAAKAEKSNMKLARRPSTVSLAKRGSISNLFNKPQIERKNSMITSQLLRETIKEHLLLEQESELTKIEEKPRPKTTQGRQQLAGTKKEQRLNTKEIKTKSTDDNRTTLAQISQLKKGDVFGLESLVSKPSTTLSLVSEGAECILISKRLFLSEASIKVLRIVNDLVQNYPCHSYIRDQVDCYRKWVQYKHDIEEDILTSHQQKDRVWVGGVPALKCAS
ncbi:uncharacterized protein LOC127716609 [Mytilus californianus]|uniref:uncharacterized protein LOC127716609 n=1 Tax=Mytilus californianus TaxID=6549 RepID=UPI0022453FE3|nr:uncharacterized protein LOC127716609 [Mytilus californianus]